MATNTYYVTTGVTPGGAGTEGDPCASLSDAEGVAGAVGSATDDYIINCRGSTADTTSVTVDFATNITTGSILIQANTGEADGFYDGDAVVSTSHYRLDPGNVTTALSLSEVRITVDGLQVLAGHTASNGTGISTAVPAFTIRRCRVLNTSSTDYGIGNVSAIGTNSTARKIENCLVVGFDVAGISTLVTNFFTPTVTVQHNTVYGDGSSTSGGIRYGGSGANSGTIFDIKGNAVGNCGSGNDLIKVSAASSTDNFDDNAFEYSESTSGEIALTPASDWTSPGTSTSSDFTVVASGALDFTVTGALVSTDIRGTARSNYSVGCFELVSAGTTDTTLDADGIGSATGTGASTVAVALSGAGVSAGTFEGSTAVSFAETTLTASGEGYATATGAAILSSDLVADGAATGALAAVSIGVATGDLDASGIASGIGEGSSIVAVDLSAVGTSTGTLVGEDAGSFVSTALSAVGAGAATATTASLLDAAIDAAGASAATATTASIVSTALDAAGEATGALEGSGVSGFVTTDLSAAGESSATAATATIVASAMSAAGVATAIADTGAEATNAYLTWGAQARRIRQRQEEDDEEILQMVASMLPMIKRGSHGKSYSRPAVRRNR